MTSNDRRDLHKKMTDAVERHREIQRILGFHLLEIDRRKLWWKKGCSSLYNYCETYLKLCPEQVDEILNETLRSQG